MTSSWLIGLASAIMPRLRYRTQLRARWGRAVDCDDWLASRSFDLSRTDSNAEWVDDRTWRDLELPRIFLLE